MKQRSFFRFSHSPCLLLFLLPAVSLGQAQPSEVAAAATASATGPCCKRSTLAYVGAYLSDGKFQSDPRIARTQAAMQASRSDHGGDSRMRPSDVPDFMNLHPREVVIQNYEPPAYARKAVRHHFFLAWLRDDIVTLVYGREAALLGPQQVTADSQGRVIVSDPVANAVHVLGPGGCFRIAAGPDRRLRLPSGVAVDAEDNIYVADSVRGMVIVYDRAGNFLREIGKMGDETLFHSPTGIALDRKAGRLYLLDTPRDVLFILDLQGNILKRVGRGRGHPIGRFASDAIPLELHAPTAIALANDRIAVLDSSGSRILIMDMQFHVLSVFAIRALGADEYTRESGLAMDSSGNLYVTNVGESSVRLYDQAGHLKSSFGRLGDAAGEFDAPSGMWIDTADRAYIADTNNHRVQIFRLPQSSSNPAGAAE